MTRQHEHERQPDQDRTGHEADVDLHRVGDRLGRQLAAMKEWNDARAVAERARERVRLTQQAREAHAARLDSLRRTHQAVIERASRAIDDTVDVLMSGRPLALVVHPNAWMRGKLRAGLGEMGMEVVATCPDGAEALGIAIVEQPDLVLLDDRISSSSGVDLLGELLHYSNALVAAQVGDELVMGAMLDGGTSAVFSRRVPPAVMVEALSALVRGRATTPVQVR